jgi:branched-chain amino acid transport system substrate-binding protein
MKGGLQQETDHLFLLHPNVVPSKTLEERKMRKSKLVSVLLLVVILAMSLSACGKKAADDTIKIGYVGALSGETAVWGQAGLNGMLLTAKEINENGGIMGKQVEIIGLDGRGDPTDSVNAFRRLATEEKVLAVIGTNFSSCRFR